MTVLDKGSANPRLQCGECGRWMRLHGKRLEAVDGKVKEVAMQRFYGGCEATNGDHPCGGDVCSRCCPTKCRERLSEVEAVAAEKEERRRVFGPFPRDVS